MPLVTAQLSENINNNTAEVKAYNEQAKATYFQSLVNEIKSLEKDVMLYGFRSEGGTNISSEIEKKVFEEIMNINDINIRADKIGTLPSDRPQPLKISFSSVDQRNKVLGQAFRLPRALSIEKCIPRRYRPVNKEFRRLGWELKQVDKTLVTRTVFKGHKLVLEMKQKDEDDVKFDWTIVKEYFPEPISPTDRQEISRNREGLRPSKTIEMVRKNFVFFSDLETKEDMDSTVRYFREVYLTDGDNEKVSTVDAEFVMSKHYMTVEVADRNMCKEFKLKYEKAPFNGKRPKVSVFLG